MIFTAIFMKYIIIDYSHDILIIIGKLYRNVVQSSITTIIYYLYPNPFWLQLSHYFPNENMSLLHLNTPDIRNSIINSLIANTSKEKYSYTVYIRYSISENDIRKLVE